MAIVSQSLLGVDLPLVEAAALWILAGKFDNHLWRILLLVAQYHLVGFSSGSVIATAIATATATGIWWMPMLANRTLRPKRGSVFVTGCDSGMGKATVIRLAKANASGNNGNKANGNHDGNGDGNSNSNRNSRYAHIFAGCYDPETARTAYEAELTEDQLRCVTLVALDVTSADSVRDAATTVREWIQKENSNNSSNSNSNSNNSSNNNSSNWIQKENSNNSSNSNSNSNNSSNNNSSNDNSNNPGLTGLVQFHGVAFNGPSAYMPIEMYQKQLDVNFVGTIRIVQEFLPLLQDQHASNLINNNNNNNDDDAGPYRSRIVLTGTGGGSCSPCPPLLTAYMSSKFALEAYSQSLRQELFMTNRPIDVAVINPGFVKPTMLVEEGTRISATMWTACEKRLGGSTRARDEYGPMLDHFTEYSALQPGTHVSKIVEATEHALLAPVPRSSYKVGIDSKLAPIVGMMPTGLREWIARHGIYGKLSPNGTVQGYKV
eukprot:CAMPEP_0172377390 /NCGR_PEP_ID=MMETSP1060-20121228/68879_1 /TAXON_ID=37318 /ORGANISM="Pseudo-nitzschia pungens, Strain cf. cingulata" /LENGTH=489 /DNA_ID=CAMNT_0013105075 /DNA_START=23 /DNA_END=1492 /DNA_ORIENTATION=-